MHLGKMLVMPSEIYRFTGDFAFLSNFWVHESGLTVEHYFQAAKTNDLVWSCRIMGASSPGEAKRLGRLCPLRLHWEQEKDAVMLSLLRVKFYTEPGLGRKLINTGTVPLIEGNDWGDDYWGATRNMLGEYRKGKNKLGKLLMKLRTEMLLSGRVP